MAILTLIDDVCDELVKENYGTLGTNIFKHEYRPSPKNQIAVKLLPGLGPILASGGSSTARPKLQIYVINETLSVAVSKADAIRDHFLNVLDLIGQGVWADQDVPVFLGKDDKLGAYMFIIEFIIFS